MGVEHEELMRVAEGVPLPKMPFYWDLGMSVSANVNMVAATIGTFEARYGLGLNRIDEAAVMVSSDGRFERLDYLLRGTGWERFNSAEDLVYTNPFGTRYRVQYTFYRHADLSWRLEIMQLARGSSKGFSPLHQSLWYPDGVLNQKGTRLPMPHLSYKVRNRVAFSGEQARLYRPGSGLVHAQTCQSTYGVFSYWSPTDFSRQLYLKPRANLRDEGMGGADQ